MVHRQSPVDPAACIKRSNLLVIVLLLSVCGFAQQAEPVDALVEKKMQEMHIPGLSLAVVKNGKVIKAGGYGTANVETGTAATPDTIYKTASLSKPVIAAAIMLLVQENRNHSRRRSQPVSR
jgi:CubicO group peptidase (beta-lactamase class C family)